MTDARLKSDLIELESRLLDNEIRKSSKYLNELLHDDFLEIGASGQIYNKQETIELLRNESRFSSTATGFEFLQISDGVVLITYELTVNNPGISPQDSVRSSIWKLQDNEWKLVFHQGTPKQV